MNNQPPAAVIISTDELHEILENDNVIVLDCSVNSMRSSGDDCRLNYLHRHIKGAKFLDLENLTNQRTDLPYMMPDEKLFIDTMKRLNVRLSHRVICYDTADQQFWGYRAAWMF